MLMRAEPDRNSDFGLVVVCLSDRTGQENRSVLFTNQKLFDMANWKLRGTWNEIKGKAKQQYADLTDNDLLYEEGKEDEMIGKLQKKLGKTREEVVDWLNSL